MKKIADGCLTALFLLVIFGFAGAFILSPDREHSDEENRSLQTFPSVSFQKLADGTFSAEMNEYFADQFYARDQLVGIKGVVETALGKGENNGVLLGEDGQLAVRLFDMYKSRLEQTADTDHYYADTVKRSIEAFNKYAEREERPLVTLFPPRAVDVAVSALRYPGDKGDALNDLITSTIADACGYVDILPLFRQRYEAGEYIYYRTDHHWTSRGAYLAYCEVMKKWGLGDKIIPSDAFSVEEIPAFYGTTWSKAGMKFVPPDTMEIWSLGNDDGFVTSCYSTSIKKDANNQPVTVKEAYKTFSGWLNRDYLATKNKYAAFLDGTHNEQTVTRKDGQQRERLLLVKDSFADTLVPFLAQHFDLVIVNLANRMCDVTEYAEEYDCDRVLVVYNFENLTGNNNLASIQ